MQLILQPCGDADALEHYVGTIQNTVQISKILPHLPVSDREKVAGAFPAAVAVWGVTPGKNGTNTRKWTRMQIGDVALLYRQKQFFFKGVVAYKFNSPELARELWGEKQDGETWENIFLLTDLEPISIDIAEFNKAAGYDPKFIVQGFNVMDEEKSAVVADALALEEGIGVIYPDDAGIELAKQKLASMVGSMDIETSASRREEQKLLREILLSRKSEAQCSICGRSFPVNLLVIAHVKKRNSCAPDERRDLGNVMPVCLVGCDSFFEHGYIHIDEGGVVRAAQMSASTQANSGLTTAISALVGVKCAAWKPSSERYFEWHRRHPRKFY